MNHSPKYSLIIPVRDGGKYLKSCIRSIIDSDYHDYELIISDNHSTDESLAIIRRFSTHKAVKIVRPKKILSMSEHWEFALSKTNGQWIMIIGADDGIFPYFFKLANKLTEVASTQNIRAIYSQRAYYFWPGCNAIYKDELISYTANNIYKKRSTLSSTLSVLLSTKMAYFNLPQMYSNSIFSTDLLEDAKRKQGGKVFTTHSPDCNLAAIACSLESQYLESYIPLGWIGTSPKSTGLARTLIKMGKASREKVMAAKDFDKLNGKSSLRYEQPDLYQIQSTKLWYWEAMVNSECLQNFVLRWLLRTKIFMTLMFMSTIDELLSQNNIIDPGIELKTLEKIVADNGCNYHLISKLRNERDVILQIQRYIGNRIRNSRILSKAVNTFQNTLKRFERSNSNINYSFRNSRKLDKNITLSEASAYINSQLCKKQIVENLKQQL